MSCNIALDCTIDTPRELRLGDPIPVTGTLRNTGAAGVWILPWGTFLAGPEGGYVHVEQGGVRLPRNGRYVRYRAPHPDDFVFLAPGQACSGTIDVSQACAIAAPGDYALSFHLQLQVTEGDSEAPPHDAGRQRLEVRSPVAQLRVLPGAGARLSTWQAAGTSGGQALEEAPAPPPWTPPKASTPPNIVGSTSTEMTEQVQLAWSRGYQAAVKGWQVVTGVLQNPEPLNADYETWFGAYSATNAQTVLDNLVLILQGMSNPKSAIEVRVGTATTGCVDGIYGNSGYHSGFIVLCAPLFDASTAYTWLSWTDWDDERMVTVVHEMTHEASNTADDDVYGESEAAERAETNPALAVRTADNYGFFMLEVEGSYQEPGNGVWQKDKTPFSASIQGRPATAASNAGGSLILAWADSSAWLWVNELNLSQGSWGSKTRLANPSSPSKYRVAASGPALAAAGISFYLLYIDGDSKSTTAGDLLCLQSSDFGEHWSAPAVVVSAPGSTTSPALASGADGRLYGIFAGAGGALSSIVGTPSPEGGGVTWAPPAALGVNSAAEPSLCFYAGAFYLAVVLPNQGLQLLVSQDFTTWKSSALLPLSRSSAAPALSTWSAPGQTTPWLMCLYRGVEPDRHLYYVVYDGSSWGVPVCESQNLSQASPAVAAFQSTLYAFHQGNTSNTLWESSTLAPKTLAALLLRRSGRVLGRD